MEHINITIKGKVQGVWFRKFTEMKAKSLSIAGFVKNLPDGSVYTEAEAERPVLDQFIAWCHVGSPLANVKEVIWENADIKNFTGFVIEK
jgi:acylphosphatase